MLGRVLVVALGGLLCVMAGCNKNGQDQSVAKSDKQVGGVGVVDLVVVAKRLGRDIEINGLVDERVASLNNKLATLRSSLRRLLEEKKEKFGDDPTDEQARELKATEDRMERELLEVKRKSEVDLANYRQQLADQFREQAKPVLREVAAARGLSIVIPKNEGLLLTIDPAVEITDEVAARMPSAKDADLDGAPVPVKPKKKQPAETSSR